MRQYEKIMVPVNVNDHLPQKSGHYFTMWHNKQSSELDVRHWNATKVSEMNWRGTVKEWLEEKNNVIVVTIDDLRTLWEAGRQHLREALKADRADEPELIVSPNFETYLTSKGITLADTNQ